MKILSFSLLVFSVVSVSAQPVLFGLQSDGIDSMSIIRNLKLKERESRVVRSGERVTHWNFNTKDGIAASLETIEKRRGSVNVLNFRCGEYQAGKVMPWTKVEGACYSVFLKLLGNMVSDPEKLAFSLVQQAGLFNRVGLVPTSTARRNIGSFQLSLANDGFFSLRLLSQ